MTSTTNNALFYIYNLNTKSIEKEIVGTIDNVYRLSDYSVDDNKIFLDGVECGEQCGNKETGYPRAQFEITYSNGIFSNPKLIEKYK